MADFGPLFQLSTVDLLEKLRRDLMRLEADPADPFEAFNFFVTAHHLTGVIPDSTKNPRRLGDGLLPAARPSQPARTLRQERNTTG
jgi:hypothetical protein